MSKFLVYLCLFFIGHPSYANIAKAGDGGQGVLCGKGPFRTVQLLDLFEARSYYRLTPELFSDDGKQRNKVERAIDIARHRALEVLGPNPAVAAIFNFADGISTLKLENNVGISIWPVGYVNDTGFLLSPIPPNCKVLELAIFNKNPGIATPLVDINYLFKLTAPSIDLVGLYLHEAAHIYFSDEETTLSIRQFVLFLTAPTVFRERNANNFILLMQTRKALEPNAWMK